MTEKEWLDATDAEVTGMYHRMFQRNRRQGWAGIKAALNETRETAEPDLVPWITYMDAINERDDLERKLAKRTQLAELAGIAALIGWALAIGLAVMG